jgi:hypothetical protein
LRTAEIDKAELAVCCHLKAGVTIYDTHILETDCAIHLTSYPMNTWR